MATKTTNGSVWTYDAAKKTVSGGNGVDNIDASTVINSNGWTIAGGNGSDIIKGSSYNDIMWGDSLGNSGTNSDNGADTMYGGAGNDEMHGGNGGDVLQGDAGADVLYGDRGPDVFRYVLVSDSNGSGGLWNAATGDWIKDFTSSEGDKIDFSQLNPNGQLIGAGHPDKLTWGTGPAAYHVWTGGGFVYADTTGDGVADIVIKVTGTVGPNDFIGVNHDPKGVNDTAALLEDTSTSGNVSTNDTDSDGDTLSYTVTNAVPVPGLTFNSNGSWTFDAHNAAYQHLAAGATQVVTVNIAVSDGHGGVSSETLTITVTGVNDTATITGTSSGNVTEDLSLATGSLKVNVNDVDDGQNVLGSASVGNFTTSHGTFHVAADGTWSFDVNNASVQYLGANDTTSDSILVYSADGTASQTLSVTIHGNNDAPTITSADQSGTVSEGDDGSSQSATGKVTYNDVDTSDSHTFTATAAAYGTASVDADGTWHYTVSDSGAVDALAVGESLADSFVVTVDDGHGGLASQTVNIVINGTNDAPTITSPDQSGTVSEGDDSSSQLASGQVTFNDVDTSDSHTFTATAAAYGSASVDADGTWHYTVSDSGAVDALNVGDSLTDSFVVTVDDGHGGLASQTVSITINGTNDAAHIAGTSTGSVTEDSATTTTSGTLTDTDVDNTPNTFTAVAAGAATTNHYGTYAMDAGGLWTYTLDNTNATVNALNDGQSLTDSFTVTTVDGTSQTVTVTINGHTDNAPPTLAPVVTSGDSNNFDELGVGVGNGVTVNGTVHADTIYAGDGNDLIYASNGGDLIYGGSGNDEIHGEQNNDKIYGGDGNDKIYGENNTDIIIGGFGADELTGGNNADTFTYIDVRDRGDSIVDFTVAQGDQIDVSAIDASSAAGFQHFTYNGSTPTVNGLWSVYDAGTNTTHLYGDTDGNTSTAEFWIDLTGNITFDATVGTGNLIL